jgi:hypothetical protein
MLLRRFIEHVRTQNWIAIALDLVVVVVGVFIAFQVEQWYGDRTLRDQEFKHLVALKEDFQQTAEDLVRIRDRYETGSKAAIRLLEISRGDSAGISSDEFYNLLGAALRLGRFEVNRRTWDVLTVGGEMSVIQNDALKSQIAAFFAEVEVVLQNYSDARGMYDFHDEYIIENFDYVELTRYYHLDELSTIEANKPPPPYHDELHSVDFRNIMTDRWHFTHDLITRILGLLKQIDEIERLLAKSLSEFDKSELD